MSSVPGNTENSAMNDPVNEEGRYRCLEKATFHNNYEFVSEWLRRLNCEEKDEEIRRKRCGSLLMRASYCHSVDVVKCIVPYYGEACKHPSPIQSREEVSFLLRDISLASLAHG